MTKQPISPDDWLTRKEAAAYLLSIGCPLAIQTMKNYAANNNAGRGPRFVRINMSIVRYQRRDLDAWVAKRREMVE